MRSQRWMWRIKGSGGLSKLVGVGGFELEEVFHGYASENYQCNQKLKRLLTPNGYEGTDERRLVESRIRD